MNALPFDIKLCIARSHEPAWYWLYVYDSVFTEYANSHAGRMDYIRVFTVCVISPSHKEYRLLGKLHKIDGPAVVFNHGTMDWYINGKLHRDGDEPAVVSSCGYMEYYTNGEQYHIIECKDAVY